MYDFILKLQIIIQVNEFDRSIRNVQHQHRRPSNPLLKSTKANKQTNRNQSTTKRNSHHQRSTNTQNEQRNYQSTTNQSRT